MKIRAEAPSDYDRVRAIHEAAFGRPHEAKLVAALRSAARPNLSLVAETDAGAVGHVFFSAVTIEPAGRTPALCGLAPLAVDPLYQRHGLGSALVRAGLQQCSQLGWQAVFLVGNPAYYSRFGFVLAAPLGLTYGNDFFDRVFQVIEVTPGALRGCRGRVRFHQAFADTGTG